MQQYLICVYEPEGEPPPADQLAAVMRDVEAVNAEIQEAGAWVFAGPLHPASSATVLQVRDGTLTTTDGPYIEGKEHLGGFTVVQAEDLDGALEWGEKYARAIGLPIEVRPFRS